MYWPGTGSATARTSRSALFIVGLVGNPVGAGSPDEIALSRPTSSRVMRASLNQRPGVDRLGQACMNRQPLVGLAWRSNLRVTRGRPTRAARTQCARAPVNMLRYRVQATMVPIKSARGSHGKPATALAPNISLGMPPQRLPALCPILKTGNDRLPRCAAVFRLSVQQR